MWVEMIGKGSKRRIRLVRWKGSEKLSVVLLFLLVVAETVLIAVWLMTHSFD
jgi:hypothetical protein